MRVAFDTSSLRGHKTGIGVYTAGLVNALRDFEPGVETILLDDGATADQRTDRRIWREQFSLPRLAERARADLVHVTGFAAPLRSSVAAVLTVHDLIGVLFSQNFPLASRFYWSRYLPFTLHAAAHLIAVSEWTRQDVMRLARIPTEKITVVPEGINDQFRPITDTAILTEARVRLNLPPRFFLFVSTLEPRKGVDTLLRAFAAIANEVQESLVLVGKGGWYTEELMTLARGLGLEARVRFADYVSDADLPALYNLATAFVFPSRYEGFGLPPLEAMACGVPVISSNAAALPAVVGDAGILLPPDDAAGFAREMRTVVEDESLRQSLRAHGLARATLFSWQRAARETTQVYARVVSHDARHA